MGIVPTEIEAALHCEKVVDGKVVYRKTAVARICKCIEDYTRGAQATYRRELKRWMEEHQLTDRRPEAATGRQVGRTQVSRRGVAAQGGLCGGKWCREEVREGILERPQRAFSRTGKRCSRCYQRQRVEEWVEKSLNVIRTRRDLRSLRDATNEVQAEELRSKISQSVGQLVPVAAWRQVVEMLVADGWRFEKNDARQQLVRLSQRGPRMTGNQSIAATLAASRAAGEGVVSGVRPTTGNPEPAPTTETASNLDLLEDQDATSRRAANQAREPQSRGREVSDQRGGEHGTRDRRQLREIPSAEQQQARVREAVHNRQKRTANGKGNKRLSAASSSKNKHGVGQTAHAARSSSQPSILSFFPRSSVSNIGSAAARNDSNIRAAQSAVDDDMG